MSETLPCGCPLGRRIDDEPRHARFHELVVEQGGPAGRVDLQTVRAMRGALGAYAGGPTVVDARAVASGRRVAGWRREAAR